MNSPRLVGPFRRKFRDPFGDLILASHPDPFGRQRRVQLEVDLVEADLGPSGLDGRPDGEEDGRGQEERRLADALRRVDLERQ